MIGSGPVEVALPEVLASPERCSSTLSSIGLKMVKVSSDIKTDLLQQVVTIKGITALTIDSAD